MVPGVDPYLKDGVRWLNPAAFTTPQPGTFGNLGPQRTARTRVRAARPDVQQGFPVRGRSSRSRFASRSSTSTNRLNYENPAATLPGTGTPGVPFTDAQAGTFGYMLGPLNRTVGLGTARQTQVSLQLLPSRRTTKRGEERGLASSPLPLPYNSLPTPIRWPGFAKGVRVGLSASA